MQVFSSNASFSSNLQDIREYTLGDPRVICRILSDNLYSNKIGSIVRELSANALDAHRMSGKENVPFEVTLPGRNGLFVDSGVSFSIRDFGPGLDEEEIYSLYTSYGSSSKRSDSSQIGGFGIGSKSPFAYTDAFTVTSWKHGTMNSYICFLNGDGAPCIKKIDSGVSDEPSGMKVDIAVKTEADAETFRRECESQYLFYDVPPAGGGWKKAEAMYENEHGKLYSMQEFSGRSGSWNIYRSTDILYGHVNNTIYKLCWDSGQNLNLTYGMRSGHIGYNTLPFNNCVCVLKISGTDVDLSASREELGFTERTKKAINNAWSAFICQTWKDIIVSINEMSRTSRFEAMWQWKEKGLCFSALKSWIDAGHDSLDVLKTYGLEEKSTYNTFFVIDADDLTMQLLNGMRGYEGIKYSSSRKNPTVIKMTKKQAQFKEKNGTLVQCGTNTILDIATSVVLKRTNGTLWLMDIGERGDFKLMFVNRNATFAAIRDEVKGLLNGLPSGSFIHVYAIDDANERKRIVEAYGSPSSDRIIERSFAARKPKPKDVSVILEKKEKVKVRINSDLFSARGSRRWCCGNSAELLYSIRSGLVEKWLAKEEIEEMMKYGTIVLVTNGPDLSTTYNPSQKAFLTFEASCIAGKAITHKSWILLNEQSYQKLLNLGFKPLDAEYSKSIVINLLNSMDVEYEDFLKWAIIHLNGSSFKFQNLKDTFDFGSTIARLHSDSAISKAFYVWNQVRTALSCKMTSVSHLPKALLIDPTAFYTLEEKAELFARLEEELQWNEMEKWIQKNPVLTLASHVYSRDSERKMYADILARYLIWEEEKC